MFFKKETVESFEKVTLSESGMRGKYEYEILPTEEGAEVIHYAVRYRDGEEERVPMESGVCSAEKFIAVLNDCGVMNWDGFDGPHPHGVLDGIMFRFKAVVNGGKAIEARGSQNFPRHYRDFTDALYGILHGNDE